MTSRLPFERRWAESTMPRPVMACCSARQQGDHFRFGRHPAREPRPQAAAVPRRGGQYGNGFRNDGQACCRRVGLGRWSSAFSARADQRLQRRVFPVVVPLGEKDHFLTLVATDGGNGLKWDWIIFGDPRIGAIAASTITTIGKEVRDKQNEGAMCGRTVKSGQTKAGVLPAARRGSSRVQFCFSSRRVRPCYARNVSLSVCPL